jgi:hypothetical protein
MITVIRTVTAFAGMMGEAISWAREVAALVKRATAKSSLSARLSAECLPR